jgi:hypothetical protein
MMDNFELEFTLRDWNREYGQLQSEENTLQYYQIIHKDRVSSKVLKENLTCLESWAKYAYNCNKLFRLLVQQKELNPNKDFDHFSALNEKNGRELYITALLSDNRQPYACIRFSGIFVVVEFIDENNRVYMTYSFRTEYGKQDLFLYELEYFVYPEDANDFNVDNTAYVSYYFTSEKKLTVTKEYNVGTSEHSKEVYESDNSVNIEKNWESYPEFGQWESIVRMKRWEIGGDKLSGI